MIKESQIMKIHYITGIIAIFVVAVHILNRVVVPYANSLEYEYIISNYHNIFYTILLEALLILIAIHGFNGLRIILIELRQSRFWENTMTTVTIVAMIGIIGFGTRTIILASGM